jgi:citrate lyase subunit beta / citryl-CoA lyase
MSRLPLRPPALRRAWLFVPGADAASHAQALASGADAIVADLEEMTAAADRPSARALIISMLREAERRGLIGAVRINKLENDGHADLQGIMSGAPRAVFLPHAESPAQLIALDKAIASLERTHGIQQGTTEIVPTIESAKGLAALGALLKSSPRIRCCMLAVEDLAANLGARRTPRGQELLHARSRFLIECIAADCVPIDLPCTYRSATVLADDLDISTQLGFTSKCAVFAGQVDAINRALTPSDDDATAAGGLIAAYEAQMSGRPIDAAPWIDAPDKNNATRLLKRHAAIRTFDEAIEAVQTGNPRY